MLEGKPLAEQGGRARAITRALALTAEAIAQGKIVPEEAQHLVRRLPIPAWLYRLLADRAFRKEAKKHRALDRVSSQPYLE